ncbi:uncharacterized protein si:ch211-1a19.3 [Nothobranchius furzeri]|uniref:LOC107393079-like protein n=3 Tax=Nothobranchius furzeri TaxID=105023 RepID=A0A9D2XIB9_NOTFU|nr:putative LOC107393079-like protein [Nothobranchius furzeri]
MAADPKGSSKVKNVVMCLLAIWFVASLIVIVVWATSPDLKGSAQCRSDLRNAEEQLEGAKVVHNKDRVALEELVREAREGQERLRGEILLLLGRINSTNASLEECRQENVVLSWNVTALQEGVEQLQQKEANLTAVLGLREDEIEVQQHNLTQAAHHTESCFSLKAAAESQMLAAQSQMKACESREQYLQKQLQKGKAAGSEAPQQKQQVDATPPNAATPLTGVPALTLLVWAVLHLIT